MRSGMLSTLSSSASNCPDRDRDEIGRHRRRRREFPARHRTLHVARLGRHVGDDFVGRRRGTVIAKLARNDGSSNPGKTERAAMVPAASRACARACPRQCRQRRTVPPPTLLPCRCRRFAACIRPPRSPAVRMRHWRFVLSSSPSSGARRLARSAHLGRGQFEALSTMPSTGRRTFNAMSTTPVKRRFGRIEVQPPAGTPRHHVLPQLAGVVSKANRGCAAACAREERRGHHQEHLPARACVHECLSWLAAIRIRRPECERWQILAQRWRRVPAGDASRAPANLPAQSGYAWPMSLVMLQDANSRSACIHCSIARELVCRRRRAHRPDRSQRHRQVVACSASSPNGCRSTTARCARAMARASCMSSRSPAARGPTLRESLSQRGRLSGIADVRERWRVEARWPSTCHRFGLDDATPSADVLGRPAQARSVGLAFAAATRPAAARRADEPPRHRRHRRPGGAGTAPAGVHRPSPTTGRLLDAGRPRASSSEQGLLRSYPGNFAPTGRAGPTSSPPRRWQPQVRQFWRRRSLDPQGRGGASHTQTRTGAAPRGLAHGAVGATQRLGNVPARAGGR